MDEAPADHLLWDKGNLDHVARHGVTRHEIDTMYAAGRWVAAEDPQGRPGQERLVREVPGSGRLITVAFEWVERCEMAGGWQRRPISAWEARPHEASAWQEDLDDA